MNDKMRLGLIAAVSIILLFILSLWISTTPADADNSVRFGILTLLPPLVAIILAFITKETVLSLFIGVFVGEFMLCSNDLNIISTIVNAFLNLGSQVISCMADPWNAGIILQCLLIGGVIQLITKMGGAKALADAFAKRADTPRKAQLFTWILGLCVFFDDYANSLIVGPIMRPVMDKLKVSREKLAFVVDATAAPVAGIAIISTWIGLEISLIAAGFQSVGVTNVTGFGIFLQTIPYRFYNIFILIFIVISALTLYEFGPMKKAEQKARARKEDEEIIVPEAPGFDEVKPVEGVKLSVWNAIIPIGTLIIGALIAFYWSGYTTILGGEDQALITLMQTAPLSFDGIFQALSQSDASVALFQAALLASIVAIVMAVGEQILTIEDAISEWIGGMKTIVITGVILLLAWSLGGVIGEVGTADYLVGILSSTIPAWIVPSLIFILGALISFATGTAYGTMSILMPLAIPLAWAVSTGDMSFTIVCTSGVLTGAIFGDHCSPISDTTILSSMGTSCNHIDHVQTQIYYAIFVAIVAVVFGYIPAGFGVPWYVCGVMGIIVMFIGLRILGEKVDFDEVEEASS
ncbi:Na+/H+ antiporter NhaC family protein [Methanobrevibacter sp.]|uniref:Na+/H+ antiporter NhaC family protein n=1 Tax=Methanobrevibacter sp. TaxID=66852 RepID=UPI00257E0607|nr:Na+/H+ antiporter NhaC family protein [Methanobrevibacter sp.]MBR2665000.1 Na+/H+ antiporter NhaC family protein [Methanobrevibacter sp.]